MQRHAPGYRSLRIVRYRNHSRIVIRYRVSKQALRLTADAYPEVMAKAQVRFGYVIPVPPGDES